MDRDDRTAFHILLDRVERMARDSEGNRRELAQKASNDKERAYRAENQNRDYFDALEAHREALKKLGVRGRKLPPVPAFHAELVAQRKRDDDIPF